MLGLKTRALPVPLIERGPTVQLGLQAFLGLYLIESPPAGQAPEDEEILVLTHPSADYRHIRDGWS